MRTGVRRCLRSALAGTLLIGGLATASVAAVTAVTPGTAWANPATTLFSSTTAGTSSVIVPPGVTSVTITAVGGTGGPVPDEGNGGRGAVVTATVPVVAGQSLDVTVAANGAAGGSGAGNGGSGAGNGGGASDVSSAGTSLVVAGGGGGGGGGRDLFGDVFALDGGDAGSNGSSSSFPPPLLCSGGGAGTETGPGGPGSCNSGLDEVAASGGVGANGGTGGTAGGGLGFGAGGGGGGGYFGGGGSSTGGGGGGSSFPSADVTGLDDTATPSVTIEAVETMDTTTTTAATSSTTTPTSSTTSSTSTTVVEIITTPGTNPPGTAGTTSTTVPAATGTTTPPTGMTEAASTTTEAIAGVATTSEPGASDVAATGLARTGVGVTTAFEIGIMLVGVGALLLAGTRRKGRQRPRHAA